MSKLLYITSNPKKETDSMSLSVGLEFLNTYRSEHPDDEVIELDLYKDYIPLIDEDVLAGWGKLQNKSELNEEEQKKVYRMNELVDQFINADKYVIVTPLWNLSVPPMMRAYVDCIMMAGKTFKYTEAGPEGLLNGKKALHIQARGGIYSSGPAQELEMGDRYIKAILRFMGIEDIQSVFIEGHAYEPTNAEAIKARAIDEANGIAADF